MVVDFLLIYDGNNFLEDSLEIHPKTSNDKSYNPAKSVDTALKPII